MINGKVFLKIAISKNYKYLSRLRRLKTQLKLKLLNRISNQQDKIAITLFGKLKIIWKLLVRNNNQFFKGTNSYNVLKI